MRISDWSSDVCSSDLQVLGAATSLGAVEADAATLRLTPACCVTSYATFCDWVHDTLIALDSADKDAVVLERSEEHTSELQSLMRISYAVFCLKKKICKIIKEHTNNTLNNRSTTPTPI